MNPEDLNDPSASAVLAEEGVQMKGVERKGVHESHQKRRDTKEWITFSLSHSKVSQWTF